MYEIHTNCVDFNVCVFVHCVQRMVVPEEREGKSTEASGILARDSRLAKEDAISTRKGGQHQKEQHQVNV